MSTSIGHSHFTDWEREGERVSSELDSCHSVLVLGPDGVAAAEVALGIARVQARRRRVAVGDTVGELAPIEALLPSESPYGLMDSFLYGVSLSKIAHAVDPAQNLYLLPSGPGPMDHEALLRSERWPSLLAGFKEAGALLLVIVPPDESLLDSLAPQMDGVVLVDHAEPPAGTRVLAHVGAEWGVPMGAEPAAAVTPAAPPAPYPSVPAEAATHDTPGRAVAGATGEAGGIDGRPATLPEQAEPVRPTAPQPMGGAAHIEEEAAHERPGAERAARDIELEPDGEITPAALPRWKPLWVAGVAAVLALIAFLTWSAERGKVPASRAVADTSAARGAAAPAMPATSTAAGTISSDDIQNIGDSAAAARYAVAMAQVFNVTDANAWLEKDGVRGLPALTYSAEASGGSRTSYLVLCGAFVQRESADSLLTALRRSGVLRAQQGHVENVPVSLALYTGVPSDQAGYTIRGYRLNGVPLYPLAQGDGSVTLYVGAFPTATAARQAAAALRRGGDQPRIVYRTGRAP